MTLRNMTLIGLLGVGITAGGCTNTAAPPAASGSNEPQPAANASAMPASNSSIAQAQQTYANPAPPARTERTEHRHAHPHDARNDTPPSPAAAAPPATQIIYVQVPPPPERVEQVVARPGYVWAPGYWRWDPYANRHVWVGGSYVPERPGFYWVRGHWEQGPQGGWYFRQGYWATRNQGPSGPLPVDFVPEPPAPRNEPVGNRPGFVWAPGHWQWDRNRYDWVAGAFIPARPGFNWIPGRWERTPNRGWQFDQGHWVPRDAGPPVGGPVIGNNGYATVAPPAPRIEPVVQRPGMVWTPGYWRWEGNRYAWIGGAYVPARPGWVWVPHRWAQNPQGGWHLQAGHWQKRV